ncbi:MAG TPA: Fe2+-dependent dioxygenase [Caulobacteraceae bacterium]|nr:Fe2+-dependent dioxygenase [Caulobacteraceae bacterium]
MLTHQRAVLTPAELQRCRCVLEAADWADGKATAGQQSARAKHNEQLAEGSASAAALGEMVLDALRRHTGFVAAALPLKVFPPLFSRYESGMAFGDHVDNAIRFAPGGGRYRTDLACTLFLTDPADYDGGELVINSGPHEQRVKLPAGDLALYPATSVHRVEPVTRGARWAAVFWVQSMVRSDEQRSLLHGMDGAIADVRSALSDDHPSVIVLTGAYHNLVRMWAEL